MTARDLELEPSDVAHGELSGGSQRPRPRLVRRLSTRVAAHRTSVLAVLALLLVVGVVHAWGMDRSPARVDDEGTYVAQAWAVQHWRTLGHYTYWYDHPPLGWIQTALWTWLTRAFERAPHAVAAGREAMLVAKLASCGLLFVLARRLGVGRVGAAAAVLLFSLSPLALSFQRMVFLDNVAVPWLLAALVLAASPRRHLAAVAGSAVCFAVAVLSKETILVLLPGLVWLLWQHTDPDTRRFALALFGALLVLVGAFYPLYALVKNELLPGPGHVSLLWAVSWQLFARRSSGSVLDPASSARGVVETWLTLDPWLLGAAVLLVPAGLAIRRLRPVGLVVAIQVAMPLRDGYLPFPYVIALLPFAALLVAGVGDALWAGRSRGHVRPAGVGLVHPGDGWHPGRSTPGPSAGSPAFLCRVVTARQRITLALAARALGEGNRPWRSGAALRRGTVLACVAAAALVVTPAWARGVHEQMTVDRDAPMRAAAEWVDRRVRRDRRVVVDDSLWVDLVRGGFEPRAPQRRVIWFYKVDLDPAVQIRGGWRGIDYVVLGQVSPDTLAELPTVRAALAHSRVVASFGEGPDVVTVRQVRR